jgi:Bacterial Ig-like domain
MAPHIVPTSRRRITFALTAWLVLALACAVSVPPTGGPEDKSPPMVKATVPAADSTGVDPHSPIRIAFSEPMRQERIERMVTVNPAIEIERVHWEGNVMVIEPAHELVRDTTYVVRVKPDYEDRHGVPGNQWHEFAFATGTAPLDTARIEGKITLKRAPATRAIARCYRVTGKDTLNFDSARPDREATADRDGKFALRHLPSNGSRFVVLGFLDQNGNRFYDRDSEPAIVYPDTIVIVPQNPVVSDIELALLDPKEPGGVKGTVGNESGVDSARVMVAMFATSDSTKAAYRAVCDSTGAYEVKSVKPGEYVLRAFVDIKTDSVPGAYPCAAQPKAGCLEPSARRPGFLHVKAAAVVMEPLLVIKKEEKR